MARLMMSVVERIRVEMVIDGVTYEAELTQTDDGGASARLDIEHEFRRRPDPTETWWEHTPTGNVTVKLEAFGKLVKSERRQG